MQKTTANIEKKKINLIMRLDDLGMLMMKEQSKVEKTNMRPV